MLFRSNYLYTNEVLLYLFISLLIEYVLEFFVGLADSIMVASLGEAWENRFIVLWYKNSLTGSESSLLF